MNGRIIIKSLLIMVGFLLITPSQSSLFSQETQQLQQRYLNILKLMGDNEYDKAIPKLQQLISDHPDFSKAYKKIAEAYIFTGNLEDGQSCFEKLLLEDPDNAY
ncbi:MAG: tetratricopeptide repeat protein, partial [Thermoplasmata archaeon]